MRCGKNVLYSLVILGCCGGAHLATVKTTEPRVPTMSAGENDLTFARQHLTAAERAQPLVALGDDLSAAKISLHVLEQRPNDSAAQIIYNFSVARTVENVEHAKIQPWQHKIDIRSGGNNYTRNVYPFSRLKGVAINLEIN